MPYFGTLQARRVPSRCVPDRNPLTRSEKRLESLNGKMADCSTSKHFRVGSTWKCNSHASPRFFCAVAITGARPAQLRAWRDASPMSGRSINRFAFTPPGAALGFV